MKMKFVELPRVDGMVSLNVVKIVAICRFDADPGNTTIAMDDGHSVVISLPYEKVLKLLQRSFF